MKTIIITGATGGLGNKISQEIISQSELFLLPIYRNSEKFSSMFGESFTSGYKQKENDDFKELLTLIPSQTEEIILILNAFSIQPLKRVGDYLSDEIKMMNEVNLLQPIQLINTLLSLYKKSNIKMRIINLDSGAADFPLCGWGNYCAAKSYINSFLGVVKLENEDIKIVSVDPGVMNTEMQAQIRSTSKFVFDKVADFIGYKDNNILREPSDVAKYIVKEYIDNWNGKSLREKIQL